MEFNLWLILMKGLFILIKKYEKSSEMLSAIYTLNSDAISLTRATDGEIIDCNQVYLNQIGEGLPRIL
jgi:hypothetical protein